MTTKQFWQGASNWGFIGGAAMFIMSLLGWALKIEANGLTALSELFTFSVLCPLIIWTGRRNAALSGPEGYSYGRAIGFVFAMMVFTGIVYGMGVFVLANFIAREYYDAIIAGVIEKSLAPLGNSPQYDQLLDHGQVFARVLTNPFVLIISGIIEMVIKGGFLGLVLCAFVKKNPDMFAKNAATHQQDHENREQ